MAGEKPKQYWPNPVVNRRHKLKTGSQLPRDVPDEDDSKLFAVISDKRDQAIFSLMGGAGLKCGTPLVAIWLKMDYPLIV